MDNINDILSSLTPDDIKSLKSMADSLLTSSETGQNNTEQPSDSGFGDFLNPEMIIKISSLMNMMNNPQHSERYKLIEALKPNLSSPRRQKADEAMKIMKIIELLPIISELFKSGDNNTKL